jgi:chromosome segregation ATPase
MAKFALLICALVVGQAAATGMEMKSAANPVRKVVTLLQQMQEKVTAEGEKAKEIYEKFMCYCKTSGGDLQKSIDAAKDKIPELESGIEEKSSKKTQLDKDLTEHKADREAADTAMAEATGIREKEKAAFDKGSADAEVNLQAMAKAIAAIEKGMGASFLQSRTASKVKAIIDANKDMDYQDKQDVLSFLSGGQGDEYAPQSGAITGILKQMHDEMAKDLSDITAEETAAVKSYEELIAAKKKEVAALSKMIEEKLERVGELGVEIQTMKNDLEDTKDALAEDQKFLADLSKKCGTMDADYEAQKKVRSEELAALADTVKILNDDDALDLFKKTLPSSSASFMQVQVTSQSMRSRATSMVRAMKKQFPKNRHALDFISMALHGKKIGFEKIIGMIDELVATLKAEQADDDEKKDYCAKELDSSDDKKKGLERSIADLKTVIEEAKEGIQTLADEVAALTEGIKALDKSVAEATEQRQEQNTEYKELMANNGAAKEVLGFAKNRLNKFYNPKLYKEALVEVRAHAAPPPPPATLEAYSKKSEESNGVIGMIDLLVKDLDKEMTVAEAEEKNAQEDYEQTMKDSQEKRTQDSKSITDKEGAKAELQASLEKAKGDEKSATKELGATLEYIHSLHTECDWLMKYFDVRKEARSSEIDALGKAKDVLSGADYSFLQASSVRRTRFLRRA